MWKALAHKVSLAKQSAQNVWLGGINMVIPPLCPVSHERVDHTGLLSATAWQALNPITAPFCVCCGMPFGFDLVAVDQPMLCIPCQTNPLSLHTIRSALVYDDTSRGPILAFKHGDQTHLSRTFAPLLVGCGATILEQADFLVPVPLHRFRLLKRRYNQAAVLAQAVSKITKIPCLPDALIWHQATTSQGHKSRRERFANIRNVFVVNPKIQKILFGKNIVLIDDVLTTGATLDECAKTLLACHVKQVDALTIARVKLES